MEEVKEDMRKHDQRMENIQAAFDKIRDSATIAHYENLLMLMTTLFRSEIRDKRDMVLRMAEGIYKGLSGTLSPAIMNPSDLMPTLQRLKDAASKQQYEPLNSLMFHIYELPTTLYLHTD